MRRDVIDISDTLRIEPVLRALQKLLIAELEPGVGDLTAEEGRLKRLLGICFAESQIQTLAIFGLLCRCHEMPRQVEFILFT